MNIKNVFTIAAIFSAALTANSQNIQNTGIDIKNMNLDVNPGSDFYEYACGGWRKANPLTAEYSRYGSFEALIENNNKQLHDLIEELAAKDNEQGSLAQKIGDLYKIAMDSVKLNKDGYNPVKADLATIASIKNRDEIQPLMSRLCKKGIGSFWSFYIGADIKDSKNNLLQIMQGGLSLGERGYYIDNDDATKNIREEFRKHIEKMFCLYGFDKETAKRKMNSVMEIETRIAKPTYSATQLRNPEANYHKMTYADLKKDYSGIDWDTFFGTLGINDIREVSVGQPEPIHEVEAILSDAPVEDIKAYLEWRLIDASAAYLSDEIKAQNFAFYGTVMSGRQQDRPRWKNAVATVEGILGEALGQIYVERYFPASAKERMTRLVKNLQAALGERIQEQEWMSDETKKVAMDKLQSFYVKIGYPDKWRDYSALEIKNDSYWDNILRSCEFELAYGIETKLNKPVDKDEWHMTPQTVNAYYNPTTNEICFPAGILQPPFFDMNADDAYNYGAIGVVIGHEMTHGFDDQGRNFDKNGNFRDWWAPGDAERFDARAKVMKDFFDNINVLPDLKANGSLTLGENLADHGGLKVSYTAFKNAMKENKLTTVDGLTPEQRFFLAYSFLWADNIREEEIRNRTKSDPHSLGRWRVNGALPHIDMWYEAFGIKESDKLFIPKKDRVNIW